MRWISKRAVYWEAILDPLRQISMSFDVLFPKHQDAWNRDVEQKISLDREDDDAKPAYDYWRPAKSHMTLGDGS
jgi:hypothetical protein